jgi:hypothetical protein
VKKGNKEIRQQVINKENNTKEGKRKGKGKGKGERGEGRGESGGKGRREREWAGWLGVWTGYWYWSTAR